MDSVKKITQLVNCGVVDSRAWAGTFVEVVKTNPDITKDQEMMTTWFANAIMAGYDHARKNASMR